MPLTFGGFCSKNLDLVMNGFKNGWMLVSLLVRFLVYALSESC